ncbi:hypothetical protein [Niveispirillum sp.]|uniref:hypothetical protein n=1 Tax=Niveispirillum sp. TaxID=1917217 RepID=UPI001B572C57|nr:hypothetical protein [Niveispirillum sp.]
MRLPDSKTGAKIVHFGEAVAAVLRSIPRLKDNPWVITGTKEGARLTDLQPPWRRIRKRAELDDVRIHELHQFLKHIPYQANRTLGVLSKMFNLAEIWGLRPDGSNPCLHVKKYREEKRERLLGADEYASLGQALAEIKADGSESPAVLATVWLLMLTGCRLGEIMTLKWSYVDWQARALPLPDSRVQTQSGPVRHDGCDCDGG